MKASALLSLCVRCLIEFRGDIVTPTAHVDAFLVAVRAEAKTATNTPSSNKLKAASTTTIAEAKKARMANTVPIDENAALFIREVFYGLQRSKKVLLLTVDGMYTRHAATMVRSDYEKYLVLVYLAVMRLDEITFPRFRAFVKAQEPHKMLQLLRFLFDAPSATREWLVETWSTVYDYQ
jgi:hypothetical protein